MKISHKFFTSTLILLTPITFLMVGCKDNQTTSSASATNSDTTPAMGRPNIATGADANSATSAANPDNTKQNAADRNNASLTPVDQGNSPTDRETSAKIRQLVVSGNNNFSTSAKNVKIITVNGKVTLRGPVNTDAEKSSIDALAKQVAGDGNVDDQLEVKANQ
jgi:osmotically-inducible protein OsmY